MIAKAKEIDGFNRGTIVGDLEKENRSDVRLLFILIEFLFSPCVLDVVKNLESDFKDGGNRHYPRLLLLGVVMFCFARKINKYSDIVLQCKENRLLRLFTRGAEPCESTHKPYNYYCIKKQEHIYPRTLSNDTNKDP